MFLLYAKLGFYRADLRPCGMLHVDIFPRRLLDRKLVPDGGVGPEKLLTKVSPALTRYWESSTFRCVAASKAPVAVALSRAAQATYGRYLEQHGVVHDVLWLGDQQRHKDESPAGWIEYTVDAGHLFVKRVTLASYHPQSFIRNRAIQTTGGMQLHSYRERLVD